MIEALESVGNIYIATFLIALVSGAFPLANGEIYLGTVTIGVGDLSTALVLSVIVAIGQTITHSVLFQVARGVVAVSAKRRERLEAAIAKAKTVVVRWKGRVTVLLCTAATFGVPPMLAVSLTAGSLGVRFRTFVAIGLAGRIIRFAVIAILASLV